MSAEELKSRLNDVNEDLACRATSWTRAGEEYKAIASDAIAEVGRLQSLLQGVEQSILLAESLCKDELTKRDLKRLRQFMKDPTARMDAEPHEQNCPQAYFDLDDCACAPNELEAKYTALQSSNEELRRALEETIEEILLKACLDDDGDVPRWAQEKADEYRALLAKAAERGREDSR